MSYDIKFWTLDFVDLMQKPLSQNVLLKLIHFGNWKQKVLLSIFSRNWCLLNCFLKKTILNSDEQKSRKMQSSSSSRIWQIYGVLLMQISIVFCSSKKTKPIEFGTALKQCWFLTCVARLVVIFKIWLNVAHQHVVWLNLTNPTLISALQAREIAGLTAN
jgi:hypothetical protein